MHDMFYGIMHYGNHASFVYAHIKQLEQNLLTTEVHGWIKPELQQTTHT